MFASFVFLISLLPSSMSNTTFFDFSANSIAGKEISMNEYRGKVVLVVNVASYCGYTPQYESLQALYKKYRSRGLVVAAFPSNDFGQQEPGSDEEIARFCSVTYNVDFDLFSKISVAGSNCHPLFAFLKQDRDIKWNFEKFLVGPDGSLIARFGSATDPMGAEMIHLIEGLLP